MAAVLTEKFYVSNIQNFLADINSEAYYFWVGGILPWPVDSAPPAPLNDYEDFEQSTYHDIVFGKQITNNNISYLVPRYNWVANTIFTPYDQNNANLFSSNFYVLNTNYSVYKCIDNSNGSPSTVQPTITPTAGVFQTSDGYTWKFMYTIPSNANTLFTSANYIPVIPNTFVANNTVPGTIDIVRVPNGGFGFEGYDVNYVVNVIDQNALQIANTGVGISNFYVGSSIYLNGGLGAGQLRQITAYNGGTRIATVYPALETFVNLYIANNSGNFIIGEPVQQNLVYVSWLFGLGFFNYGDTLKQSDTGFTGTILSANSTTFDIGNANNIANISYLPLLDTTYGGVLQTGTVSITSGSNVIIASNTANLSIYSTNSYIQVGNATYTNVRRISSITNSSYATTSYPFNNTLSANVHYQISDAVEPVSSTIVQNEGIITQVNLTSVIINYGNLSSNGISFILGETVKEYNANGVDQGANGIISFVNSSALVVSSINGTIAPNYFLTGQSSTLEAQIISIKSYPNITIANSLGNWVAGAPVSSLYANGVASGNGFIISYSYSPSSTTQYIISPTVNINGDGYGAEAYCVVNTNINANYSIAEIVMINNGQEYTEANVTVTANSNWGSSAVLYPVISPAEGHGSNTYVELGARYAGITMQFLTAANENYYFPNYGSYRKVGIIKNPQFFDLWITTSNVSHYAANITVSSSNNFIANEIIYQPASNSAAFVIYANTTYLELKNICGNMTSNTSNSSANSIIYGLQSNAASILLNLNAKEFILNNDQTIEITTANSVIGNLSQVVSNNLIRLTNVSGKFTANQTIFDPTTNAYANALALAISNGTVNATSSFGLRFNQTSRLTFGTNTYPTFFQVGESINQSTSNAQGVILDTTHELDLTYTAISGSFTTGIIITDANTNANGVIVFANSSYLKITAVNGTFGNGHLIKTISANATLNATYHCVVVSDLQNEYPFQVSSTNVVIGNTSGAQGYISISNSVSYADLVRNSGQVIYVSYVSPFTMTPNTNQQFTLQIQM